MDEESKYEFQSPWKVENLDEYLFYCCPECDHKTKTKSLFIDHACKVHEGAKECLVQVKIESDSLVINSENLQIKLEEAEEEYEYEEYPSYEMDSSEWIEESKVDEESLSFEPPPPKKVRKESKKKIGKLL